MAQKTWKAAKKRIQVTKRKKLFKKPAGQNHFNNKERGTTVINKRRKIALPHSMRSITERM